MQVALIDSAVMSLRQLDAQQAPRWILNTLNQSLDDGKIKKKVDQMVEQCD